MRKHSGKRAGPIASKISYSWIGARNEFYSLSACTSSNFGGHRIPLALCSIRIVRLLLPTELDVFDASENSADGEVMAMQHLNYEILFRAAIAL